MCSSTIINLRIAIIMAEQSGKGEDGVDTNEVAASKKRAAARMRQLTYPVMTRVAIGISALAVNSATNMSFPWIMGKAIDIVSGDGTGAMSHRFKLR